MLTAVSEAKTLAKDEKWLPSTGRIGESSFGAAGRYVVHQMTERLVDADFVVECDGKRLGSGHVTSWKHGDAGGSGEFGTDPSDETGLADLASRLACT